MNDSALQLRWGNSMPIGWFKQLSTKVQALLGRCERNEVEDNALVVDEELTLTQRMPRSISATDLDECARILGETRILIDCLRYNKLQKGYLATSDASVLDALPGAIEFLRALSFDVDDYLSSTAYSHEWLREHGHGD
jgi:hypothetical protein